MAENIAQTFEHVLLLHPGETGSIEFRFPKDRRRIFKVTLAAADSASGSVELILDNLTRGYEMLQVVENDDEAPWTPLEPAADGRIHAVLDLRAGETVSIESDDQFSHSLRLADVAWQGDAVRLTFREEA